MASKVTLNPFLPPYLGATQGWANNLINSLLQAFNQYAARINISLPEDGSEAMTGPMTVASVVYASLPASPSAGMILRVSNANTNTWGTSITGTGADNVLAWYNGSAWTVIGK